MAYKSSARGTRPVSLLGVHTAEGARNARSLAAYFSRDDIMASSHDVIDAVETLPIVPYTRAAWTMRSANPISDNVEVCAFARWTREQWLSTDTVDGCANPRAILDRLGDWVAKRCAARDIPVRRLTIVQLQQGWWGVIAHDDWTKAMLDGTHWDPGPGFPWDYVLARAAGAEEDDMQLSEIINWRPVQVDGAPRSLYDSANQTRADCIHIMQVQAAHTASLAAIAQDKDVTPEQMAAAIDKAVAAHTPTAEQVAAAQRPFLLDVVREALGEDNVGQADAIVDALARRLAIPEGTEV